MAKDGLTTLSGWPQGVDNITAETDLSSRALREAVNVDLNQVGKPRLRQGFAQRYAGAGVHSLWSGTDKTLFVEAGALKRLWPDYSVTTIRTGLDQNLEVSYEELDGVIRYSNGAQTGAVSALGVEEGWGVEDPAGQPTVAQGPVGGLTSGRYQVAVTFVSAAGEESGSTLATVVEAETGVSLTNIPQGDAAYVRVYMTEPGGEVLKQQAQIPMGVTAYQITSVSDGPPLDTQFARRMPAGHIVRYFSGMMWVAKDNVLWYSIALRYGVNKPQEAFFQFPERITIVQPVDDGVYVVSDKTYFIAGTNPRAAGQVVVSPNRGIEGTGAQIDTEHFDIERAEGTAAFWYSNRGAMIGLTGGRIEPVMENKVALPEFDHGSTLFREDNGIRQLITTLRGQGTANSFGASDSVVAEVRTNAVTT
ncbi:MAG: hypothetical protein GY764_05285 [Halieaceae bacterium]|nr:hypothetical protein [Halieaceae bacterium]